MVIESLHLNISFQERIFRIGKLQINVNQNKIVKEINNMEVTF